jgi:hypothetical protein
LVDLFFQRISELPTAQTTSALYGQAARAISTG